MYNFYHLKISTSLQILFINVTKDNLDLKIYTRFQNYASLNTLMHGVDAEEIYLFLFLRQKIQNRRRVTRNFTPVLYFLNFNMFIYFLNR